VKEEILDELWVYFVQEVCFFLLTSRIVLFSREKIIKTENHPK